MRRGRPPSGSLQKDQGPIGAKWLPEQPGEVSRAERVTVPFRSSSRRAWHGVNAFLFHPKWGPWVHLRVMASTAELAIISDLSGGQFCDSCGLCISECPAHAISKDSFEGLRCRSYRKARGEYDPQGPRGLLPYCLKCIWVCPKGEQAIPR